MDKKKKGRPKIYGKRRVMINRIAEDVYEQLDDYCIYRKMPRNTVVNLGLKMYLKKFGRGKK